jgi:hypothetical protein
MLEPGCTVIPGNQDLPLGHGIHIERDPEHNALKPVLVANPIGAMAEALPVRASAEAGEMLALSRARTPLGDTTLCVRSFGRLQGAT